MKNSLICLLCVFLTSCDFLEKVKFAHQFNKENQWIMYTIPGDTLRGTHSFPVKRYTTNGCSLVLINDSTVQIEFAKNKPSITYDILHNKDGYIVDENILNGNIYENILNGNICESEGIITIIKYIKNNKVIEEDKVIGFSQIDDFLMIFQFDSIKNKIINYLKNGYDLMITIDGSFDEDIVLNIKKIPMKNI